MKFQYQEIKFSATTEELLYEIIQIVNKYHSQGYKMSLRQLYYQLVSENILQNKQNEYSKLSRILTKARLSGRVDWDFIEDRIRVPKIPAEFENLTHAVNTLTAIYRLDRWQGQEYYIEVWVEKDALSGVLEPVTRKYHTHLLVNRGYSSASALHDSALRLRHAEKLNKKTVILYLGDHDPSGEDMVRDIRNRLEIFFCDTTVKKLALTIDQIKKYNLPPNPTKLTDPRANEYVIEHGNNSWELDALPPDILVKLVTNQIHQMLNIELFNQIIDKEQEDKEKLESITENM